MISSSSRKKGLSKCRKCGQSDSIPLNESFETQETSDTYGTTDASRDAQTKVMDVWGLNRGANAEKSVNSESQSFASLETAKVTNTAKQNLITNASCPSDAASPYSPSLEIMCESTGDEETLCHEVGTERLNSGHISTDYGIHVEEAHVQGKFVLQSVVQHEADDEKTDTSYIDKRIKRRLICAVLAATTVFSLCVAVIAMFAAGDKGEQNLEQSNAPPSDFQDIWEGDGSDNQLTGHRLTSEPIPAANRPVSTQYPTASPILQPSKQPARSAASNQETRFPSTSADSAPDTTLFPVSSPTRAPAKPIPIAVAPMRPPQLRPTKPGTLHPTTPPTASQTRSPTHAPIVLAVIPLAPPPVPATAAPSAVPQLSPSDSPTCRDIIAVNEECVLGWRDDINVDFGNCDPKDDDWIGIWSDDENPDDLSENYVDWVWSCGTQSCIGSPNANRVVFEKNRLPLGNFRAFLVHEPKSEAPYSSHVMSQSFAVTNYCGFI